MDDDNVDRLSLPGLTQSSEDSLDEEITLTEGLFPNTAPVLLSWVGIRAYKQRKLVKSGRAVRSLCIFVGKVRNL